jgi:hypothetical protein
MTALKTNPNAKFHNSTHQEAGQIKAKEGEEMREKFGAIVSDRLFWGAESGWSSSR